MKNIILVFITGILLVFIGVFLKIFKVGGADTVLAAGLLSEFLFAFLFIRHLVYIKRLEE
ncbi:MAG: hypothetical protein ACK5H1_00175 [Tenacibaculum sp.]